VRGRLPKNWLRIISYLRNDLVALQSITNEIVEMDIMRPIDNDLAGRDVPDGGYMYKWMVLYHTAFGSVENQSPEFDTVEEADGWGHMHLGFGTIWHVARISKNTNPQPIPKVS